MVFVPIRWVDVCRPRRREAFSKTRLVAGWYRGFAYPGGGSLRTKETGAALIFKALGCVIISSWACTSCVRRNRAFEIGDNTALFVTGRTAAGEIQNVDESDVFDRGP
jgi:hypothetical protein